MLRIEPPRGAHGGSEREIERRIVGRSAAMQVVRDRVRALARLSVPVLIRGEAGTGLTHVARTLHAAAAPGAGGLYVFDARRPGSPPGSLARKTLLIEEVGALPAPEQARWHEQLRRSETGAEGAPRRIFVTSSRELSRLVAEVGFAAELRDRLERFRIDLPPLRERREDVPDLVRALGERAAGGLGRERVQWTREALRLLAAQSWPGNLRELAALVERLVAFDTEGRIGRARVAALLEESPSGVASSRLEALRRQREELARAIEETGGNLAEVARRLRMSRGGVIYRAQKFGLLPRRAGSSGSR
jgi:DNA-binding NtrC family response regulator